MKSWLLALLLTASSSALLAASDADVLHELFADDWQFRLDESPGMAARFGDEEAYGLTDMSQAALDRRNRTREGFLKRLAKIDRDALSPEDRINYDIFKAQLRDDVADYKFGEYQAPLTSESSFHSYIASIAESGRFRKLEDYQRYLKTLRQVPEYFRQQMGHMRAGLKRGFTQPRAVIGGHPDGIGAYIKEDPAETEFYKPFKEMPSFIAEADAEKARAEARRIIADDIMPAYREYQRFMAEEYIPGARDTIGAIDLPDGRKYYEQQIREYTTLDLSPEEIHKIGLEEVARIRGEMDAIIESVKFEGDFAAFLQFLRTDPQFYATTPEELLKEASYLAKKMDGKLPKLFTVLPRQPYTVEPVPAALAPNYTTGRYSGAPIDSDRPGAYWVNTYALDKRPLYNLEALTLHEAVPGHHLQTALAQELDDLPNFRRYSYISAFGEGWGLYSERLGKEVGMYEDPYSDFGRLTYEMWRAIRLVVDTGMHAMGWSRARAIDFMESNTALSTHNVRTEIDRYISWPGQALSYKLGEIKIRELRTRAEQALGEDFDVRLFHDAILAKGSVPLKVLEDQIDAWIKQQQEGLSGKADKAP